MKRFSQIIILVIASLGVLSLAIFTYQLIAYTLHIAFVGQYSQSGPKALFLFQSPNTFFENKETPLFDERALRNALFLDNTPYEYLQSGSIDLKVSGGSITLELAQPKDGTQVRISADNYNKATTTPYRLSKDLFWTYKTDNSFLEIIPYESTGSLLYQVVLTDHSQYTSADIRWYTSDNPSLCNVDSFEWSAGDFYPAKAFQYSDIVSDYPVYQLDIDADNSVSCIVAGIGNNISVIDQGSIGTFEFSGTTLSMRSPTINLQTHIRFETQSTLAQDNPDQYLEYISIVPEIPISQQNITIGPSYIDLFLPLEADARYTISLDDIPDIYGRTASYEYDIKVKNQPSLSLKLQSESIQPYFGLRDEIYAQIFASEINRTSYKVQVCKLEPSQYLRLRQHLETITENDIKTYNYISMHSPGSCFQKDISANTDNIKTPFRLDTFSPDLLDSGIYMLSFVDKSILQPLSDFVEPQFFAIADTSLIATPNENGTATLFAMNTNNFYPRANEEIYMYVYRDSNQVDASSTSIPRVLSLGTTNEQGSLPISSSLFQQIGDIFSHQGIYTLLILGSQEHFGFVENPEKILISDTSQSIQKQQSTSQLFISQNFLSSNDILVAYGYTHTGMLVLKTPQGDVIREYEINPQDDTFFVQNILFDSEVAGGKYNIEIANTTTPGSYTTLSRSLDIQVQGPQIDSSNAMQVNFVLQSNTIDSLGVPEYLKNYTNNSGELPWYDQYFSAPISFEGIIQVSDKTSKTPISYAEYEYEFYEVDNDTGESIQIDQGKGTTDTDGFGYIRVSVDFQSYGSDKLYICNLTLTNPITGEILHTTKKYLVSIPSQESYFRDDIPLQFSIENTHLHQGDTIIGDAFFEIDTPDPKINSGSYEYTLSPLSESNSPVLSGSLTQSHFSIEGNISPGIYQLTLAPSTTALPQKLKQSLTSHHSILVEGSGMILPDNLQIIPKNTNPAQGDILTVSFVAPYQNGGMIVSAQQGRTHLTTEYHTLSASLLTQQFQLSSYSSDPLCIWAQAFGDHTKTEQNICISVSPKHQGAPDLQISDSQVIPGQNINYAFQSKTSNRYHTNFFLVSKSDESAAIHWFDSLRDTQTNQENNFDEHFDLISLDDTVSFSHSYSGTLTLPNTISGNYSLIALTTSVSGENHIYSFPLDISFPYDLQLETPDFAYKGDTVVASVSATNTSESISQLSFVIKIGTQENAYRSQQDSIINIGQKTTARFEIPIDNDWSQKNEIQAYLKQGDTIIASTSAPISLLDSAHSKYAPEFNAQFFASQTDTGSTLSGSLYSDIHLSLGSDVRVFLVPLLSSLQFQSTPDTSSQLSLLFARTFADKIASSLSGTSLPTLDTLYNPSFVLKGGQPQNEENIGEWLDALLMLVNLRDMGIQVSNTYKNSLTQSVKYFLETNQNNYLFADAYRVFADLGVEGADTIREQIDTDRLDRHSRIVYMAGLQSQRKAFSGEIFEDAMQSVLSGSTESQRGWTIFSDRMILVQVLLNDGKQNEAQQIFRVMMQDFITSPHIFSFQEIREGLRAILLQTQKSYAISPVEWQFAGGALKIQNTLSTNQPYFAYWLDTQKIDNNTLQISAQQNQNPDASFVYSLTPRYRENQNNMRLTQTIEAIDTSAGIYPDGSFKKSIPISGDILAKNTLYRISIEVENNEIPENQVSEYVLDIPLISGVHSFFSSHIIQDGYSVPMIASYQSLTHFSGLYQPTQNTNQWKYVYYIRPQFSGKYTFPPLRVYLRSQPQIGSSTSPKTFIIP